LLNVVVPSPQVHNQLVMPQLIDVEVSTTFTVTGAWWLAGSAT